ncbi:hypothetical protein WA026_008686 [Henosepilachna vigintioctopunctata]|uniref:Uncharacterized protein n=1 Tax=Henosepilachna vigintioctopunctata TaxID=420089 RepID=A0AAW1V9T0_9CUCU
MEYSSGRAYMTRNYLNTFDMCSQKHLTCTMDNKEDLGSRLSQTFELILQQFFYNSITIGKLIKILKVRKIKRFVSLTHFSHVSKIYFVEVPLTKKMKISN